MRAFNPALADIAWSGRPYQLLHKVRSDHMKMLAMIVAVLLGAAIGRYFDYK